jgi:hypothetical protein
MSERLRCSPRRRGAEAMRLPAAAAELDALAREVRGSFPFFSRGPSPSQLISL